MNIGRQQKIKGEIITILTLGTLVILGISTFVSSFLIRHKQTIKSEASTTLCSGNVVNIDGDSGGHKWVNCGKPCNSANGNEDCKEYKNEKSFDPSKSYWCYGATNSQCIQWQIVKTAISPKPNDNGGQNGGGATTGGDSSNNGCFSLKAEFETKNEGGKTAFYSWVTFNSTTAGDVELLGRGTGGGDHLAGWNAFPGPSFTYGPAWTQNWKSGTSVGVATLSNGKKTSLSYTGFLRNCNPQDQTINCTLSVSNNEAHVEGNGCSCRGGSCTTGKPQPTSPPNPTSIPNPTSPPNPTSIPPLKTVTDIPTPVPTTEASTPTPVLTQVIPLILKKTCTNYGLKPPKPNVSCPRTYSEPCGKGTRYVKIGCGVGNDSCQYSCKIVKDVYDSGSNGETYSGDCANPNTCSALWNSDKKKTAKITVEVNGISSCNYSIKSIGVYYKRGGLSKTELKRYSIYRERNMKKTFSIKFNILPIETIIFTPYTILSSGAGSPDKVIFGVPFEIPSNFKENVDKTVKIEVSCNE